MNSTETQSRRSVQRLVRGHEPRHLDLFSGIGGFALAAQWTGWKTIAFSEIEPYACKVLKRHWPDVPNFGDIRNVRGVRAELVTGGFPCQPYSLAGKRRGASDDRALWPEMRRVIAEARPAWVLGENVPGIIGMELDRVLDDLEDLGYATWPLGIPACAVDARHRRERIWIVAHSDEIVRGSWSNGREYQAGERALHEPARPSESAEPLADTAQGRIRRGEASGQTGQPPCSGEDVSHADDRANDESGSQCNQRQMENGDGQGNRRGCVWLPEPELGRVANGIPNRSHRLKGLGNAIVPQVAAIILEQMFLMTPNNEVRHGGPDAPN
jgi:DNA (cytosine-5)-methyltransferase 1